MIMLSSKENDYFAIEIAQIFARGLHSKWSHFMMMRKRYFSKAIKINFWPLIAVNYFLVSLFKCGKLFGTYNCLRDVDFFKSHDTKYIFVFCLDI